jgi:ArsR family transcriptional regulator
MDRAQKVALKNEEAAKIAQALTNPVRLKLLGALNQREMHVDELAERLGLPRGNTSAQLRGLHRAGLVAARRDGRRVFYRLSDPAVARLLVAVQATAEHTSAAFQGLLRAHFGEVTPLDAERLRAVLADVHAGRMRLLDLRSPEDHAASHLPGAENLPLPRLEADGPEALGLDPSQPVALYCRGRYCVAAADATTLLRAKGFAVTNLFASAGEALRLLAP